MSNVVDMKTVKRVENCEEISRYLLCNFKRKKYGSEIIALTSLFEYRIDFIEYSADMSSFQDRYFYK